ncbi:hypothetical protein RFI_02248 [Reticulomyxa filosa]|uniref:Uncharacterized protein n=1 Tax=Reticulomyxa filosa TaxID=46433 RepID=X6P9T9_RETFI|nr:hypothetical protein RFI_02248 [Reticulomyxa filosa]|eukprot:ETO34839.1 hypothetical protein RFI_02248 [Reticulomyxa filosa]
MDDLFVCYVWKNKIHHDLKNRDMIAEINRCNDYIVVYYVSNPSAQYREEYELIELPLLLTRNVSFKEVRQKLLDLIRPFLTSKEKQLPFIIYTLYGNNTVLQLEEKDSIVHLTERSFRFLVHFPERNEYNEHEFITC